MNLFYFPILPSFNLGGKTVSPLEAKNFFEAKFFFQAEKFKAKIFFTSQEIDPREESCPLNMMASAEPVCSR